MAKRGKCQHGNRAIRLDGCAECVRAYMQGGRLLMGLGIEFQQLIDILRAFAVKHGGRGCTNEELAEIAADILEERGEANARTHKKEAPDAK